MHSNRIETKEEATLRLASALSIVWLCAKNEIDCKHEDISQPLLYGLRITSQSAAFNYDDYKQLMSVHFKSEKR
jgi:hypothetical protein